MDKIASLRYQQRAQFLLYSNGFSPYLVAYMVAKHFSAHDILILMAVTQLACAPIQIPAGIVADRYSKTRCLIFGSAACALSMGMYALAGTWTWVLIAGLVGGVGTNFFVGADGAFVRQTYRQYYPHDWEPRNERYAARMSRFQGLVEAGTCLVASALAWWVGLYAVIAFQGGAYIVAFLFVTSLREPPKISKEADETEYYLPDPAMMFFRMVRHVHPGTELSLSLMTADPEYQPSRGIAMVINRFAPGRLDVHGRFHSLPRHSTRARIQVTRLSLHLKRHKVYHVVQLPPTHSGVLAVLKVQKEITPAGTWGLRVLAPAQYVCSWPTLPLRPILTGPMVPVRGPARLLLLSEYEKLVKTALAREKVRQRRALVALIAMVGTLASLTAVTYRLAPLYFESLRYSGSLVASIGFGWIWSGYLAGVWLLGTLHNRAGRLSHEAASMALAGLIILGGGCYAIFGLSTSVIGLAALVGLAFVRSQESVLATKYFNELASVRRQASVLSIVCLVQDGMAAVVLLLAGWLGKNYGFSVALIGVGAVHTAVAGLALGVLTYLYQA